MRDDIPPTNDFPKALASFLISAVVRRWSQEERDALGNDIRRLSQEIREAGPVDPVMEQVLDFGDRLERQLAALKAA